MRRVRLAPLPAAILAGLLGASCSSSSAPPQASKGVLEDGSVVSTQVAPSCKAAPGVGVSGCGSAGESCCASLPVPAGEFFRSYDDSVTTSGMTKVYPAKLSAVSVDKYEVTVARFREFVAAETAGWRPSAGDGKHTELHGGAGLNGGKEPGWDASWSASLPASTADWSTNLACDQGGERYATWSASSGPNEDHPINCLAWYDAYAFCIWDGFLPTEAEWNYTAAGGSDQRAYPWSSPPKSATLDCEHADYSGCASGGTTKVGAESPMGDGRWGHADLAGNVFEWTLDWDATYTSPCDDCANLDGSKYRVIRGGGFDGAQVCLFNSLRETAAPEGRSTAIGVRCARP